MWWIMDGVGEIIFVRRVRNSCTCSSFESMSTNFVCFCRGNTSHDERAKHLGNIKVRADYLFNALILNAFLFTFRALRRDLDYSHYPQSHTRRLVHRFQSAEIASFKLAEHNVSRQSISVTSSISANFTKAELPRRIVAASAVTMNSLVHILAEENAAERTPRARPSLQRIARTLAHHRFAVGRASFSSRTERG